MKIALGNGLKKAKQLENEVQKLRGLRKEVSTVSYINLDGSDILEHETTVYDTTLEILDKQMAIRYLRYVVAKANLETIIPFGDTEITLAEALTMLPQKLTEVSDFSTLANRRPIEKENFNRYSSAPNVQYTKVTYDISTAKMRLKELEEQVLMLRNAIDKANISNFIEVPDEYLM